MVLLDGLTEGEREEDKEEREMAMAPHQDTDSKSVVNGTGNPWVKLTLPILVPVKTRTCTTGTGFSVGQTYITQGIPVPIPTIGTHGSTTTKYIYIIFNV
jgi:hypothetical protein